MYNIPLILRTVIHLRPKQVFYQLHKRMVRPEYKQIQAPVTKRGQMSTYCISKPKCLDGGIFCFLNLASVFTSWNDTERGNLWCYNLNYMDWLEQEGLSEKDGIYWIDKFISDIPTIKMGLDPYPIALRCINWVKFFQRYPNTVSAARDNALYSQLKLLERKLEYHLLGNHLLEDSYALYIGAAYFNDADMMRRAEKLLMLQLNEQILSDGMHYEQSPMYHCILLDRLLDCINFRKTEFLCTVAGKMLGFLEGIVWKDMTIPLFNDAAYGIAPTPKEIFDYANRLKVLWKKGVCGESGYRKMFNNDLEAILDVGNITASYQPGHSHADTFSYELRVKGCPVVVDTGISTYNKTPRRQYERSSEAHNTVVVDGKNSSEVWGGFRVGRRCSTQFSEDTENAIVATHNGFQKQYTRAFKMTGNAFILEDWYDGEAVSYIHLAENESSERFTFEGAIKIEKGECEYSTEYNRFHKGLVLKVLFKKHLKTIIHV